MSALQKDEGPTVAAAGPHVAAPSVSFDSARPETNDKVFTTLRARLALAGHGLSRTDGSDGPCRYFVTRWGMVRELRDLDAVKRFAEQVGVAHE